MAEPSREEQTVLLHPCYANAAFPTVTLSWQPVNCTRQVFAIWLRWKKYKDFIPNQVLCSFVLAKS